MHDTPTPWSWNRSVFHKIIVLYHIQRCTSRIAGQVPTFRSNVLACRLSYNRVTAATFRIQRQPSCVVFKSDFHFRSSVGIACSIKSQLKNASSSTLQSSGIFIFFNLKQLKKASLWMDEIVSGNTTSLRFQHSAKA